MKDLRYSIYNRTPYGTTVLKPVLTNSAIRAHALALQRIQNREDQATILAYADSFRDAFSPTAYALPISKRYINGS